VKWSSIRGSIQSLNKSSSKSLDKSQNESPNKRIMKRSKSSSQWLADHEDDEFVKRARADGYRSRASYKLLEIDDKFHLLKAGSRVVDLGSAPGSWSQVAKQRVGQKGEVIALDILDMLPIDGVTFIQGDFTEEEPLQVLLALTGDSSIDLVISDMAPNLSGMKDIDQPRSAYLIELAYELATRVLRINGSLLVKCFEGDGIDAIRQLFRGGFKQVSNIKPRASRGKSREIYLLGRGFRGVG
jgi:23S rRNA (uridine2552-2'-O)-methyltransferase